MYWHFAVVVVDIDLREVRSRADRILLRATSGRMSATEMRSDMPMRLIVRAAALVVTSGIAVTALLAGPHGGIPAWGTGLVLSIVLLAVAAGAALDLAEWKEAQRGHLSGGQARHARAAVSSSSSSGLMTAAAAAVPDQQAAWAAATPLWPLRVCFTLQHKTSRDVLSKAFSQVGVEPREAMSRAALDGWLERYSGFGEWPIKRAVEMTVEIDVREPGGGGRSRGVVRFQRLFSDAPVEVRSVSRVEDRLFQDNDVSGWVVSNATGKAWSVADLEHAIVRVKTVYLSFDEEDFRQPPRFDTLHLCFGEPARGVFSFTAAQLAAPAVRQDPAPLMRGPFFKTLLLEYELSVSQTTLAEQLVPVNS
jgi:hypothetical protein